MMLRLAEICSTGASVPFVSIKRIVGSFDDCGHYARAFFCPDYSAAHPQRRDF
jgi:hypothetical protein